MELKDLVRDFLETYLDTEVETMIEEGCDGQGYFAQLAEAVGMPYDPWRNDPFNE